MTKSRWHLLGLMPGNQLIMGRAGEPSKGCQMGAVRIDAADVSETTATRTTAADGCSRKAAINSALRWGDGTTKKMRVSIACGK